MSDQLTLTVDGRTVEFPCENWAYQALKSGDGILCDYCNRVAQSREAMKKHVGKEHPEHATHWDKSKNYGTKWHDVRNMALARDNHTCQECGKHASEVTRMDVHHIIPVKCFDNPRDAHFLDNTETLCRACHKSVEPARGDY